MSWDATWEEVFRQQEWGKYPGEDLIRFVARNFYNVEKRSDIKILEVGCGPGANLWFIAREGFSVYGIDGSPTAIERAGMRLDNECSSWKGELQVGDIEKLPYLDDFFDAVIDVEAVSCNSFESAKRIYSEMIRVCKVNGKIFTRTFASGCWGDKTGEKVGHNAWIVEEGPLLHKGYTRFTEKREVEELLGGVKIKEMELLTRTMENQSEEIKEWLIVAEKKT